MAIARNLSWLAGFTPTILPGRANGASSDELRVQTEAGLLTVELSGSGVQEAIFGDGFEPVPEQF